MIDGKRVLALITARGGSKGLPGKNVRELMGRPLVGWPIRAALGSAFVDRVIVSTDDEPIADRAREQGAETPFMRPSELATDQASSAAAIEHALSWLKEHGDFYDYLVLLEPTSPLTESQDVDQALERLAAQRSLADSIVGVSRVEAAHPVYDVRVNELGVLEPYLAKDFSGVVKRQDISELYFFEGSLYISDVEVYLEKKTFYHQRTLPYIVPKWKAFEVDDIVDFVCIEAIMKNLEKFGN